MKNISTSLALMVLVTLPGFSQITPVKPGNGDNRTAGTKSDATVKERGPHHKVWEQTELVPAPDGRMMELKHSYTELATGMHFQNDKGEWEESKEVIDILPHNAGAMASKGQHKAIFPPELKSGLLELQTPDGKWLKSRVWGLAYFDAATGESVLLAEVKESEGQLVGDNVVIYADAFTDFTADVRYTYTRAGFEQDVVLREQPPAPEKFGLNPQSTYLQVLTEFVEAPQPVIKPYMAGNIADEVLGFGSMSIGLGKAFSTDAAGTTGRHVPVIKDWQPIEGRPFLIEQVRYKDVFRQIEKLPPAKKYEGASLLRRGQGKSVLAALQKIMPKKYVKSVPRVGNKRMAQATPDRSPSFVMDYITLTTQADFTFKGDATHYVSGTVNLTGTTTLEGGAVVKFAKVGTAQININDPQFVVQTDPYRPVVFTAKDDNWVGETISGSSGNPTGYYGGGIYYCGYYSAANPVFDNMRFCYLSTALALGYDDAQIFTVANTQMIKCDKAIYLYGAVNLRNMLFNEITSIFSSVEAETAWYGEHLTVNRCENFVNAYRPELHLTNCLLVQMTNLVGAEVFTALWYTNQVTVLASDSGVFQTVGGGAHYLAVNSPYRDIGVTNTTAAMLAILKKKTTYPPVAYTNITFTTATTFNPQAQRDTDTPDLGYHYDPLDYTFGGCHANSNLTFTAGTAVGWFRTSSGWYHAGQGLHLGDQQVADFTGMVTAPCFWVRLTTVQENDRTAGYGAGGLSGWAGSIANAPEVRARFTRFSMLAGDGNHLRDDYGWLNLRARDCEFSAGGAGGYIISMYLTNCLLQRTYVAQVSGEGSCSLVMRNCTMIGNYLQLLPPAPYTPTFKIWDCAFDGTTLQFSGTAANATYAAYNYNTYTNSTRPFPSGVSGPNDVVVAGGFNWQSGQLGNHYLTNSSSLINVGSLASAASIGLYHYTTQTNQTKEATSQLDIGYHYVAVDGNSVPLDSDADGLADYLEDGNGDGNFNAGDLGNWNSNDPDGDGVPDWMELAQGRNPNSPSSPGAVADTDSKVRLQIHTPLK